VRVTTGMTTGGEAAGEGSEAALARLIAVRKCCQRAF
jgi:hypothetical protein